MIKKLLLIFLLITMNSLCFSKTTDLYAFNDAQSNQRFQALTEQLRCLVCQNQSLSESQAPLAADLRRQVAAMINTGQSDQAILKYLTSRFGDFILYRPPLNKSTFFLWFAPFMLLIFLFLGLVIFIRRRIYKPAVSLTEQQRRALQQLLARSRE